MTLTPDQKTVICALTDTGMTALQTAGTVHIPVVAVLAVAVPHLAVKGWTVRTISLALDVKPSHVARHLQVAA